MRKLKNLGIGEVSVVRRPANQRARVLFHKALDRGRTMPATSTADALIAGIRKAVDAVEIDDPALRKAKAEEGFAEAHAALVAAETAAETAAAAAATAKAAPKGKGKKGAPAADPADDPDGDDDMQEATAKAFEELGETMLALKKSADEATARVTTAESTAKAATDRVTALEKSIRETEIKKEAHELTSAMGGSVDNVVKTLTALDGNKDARAAYVETLKTANLAAAKANLTVEMGRRTPVQLSADAATKQKADEMRAADPKLTEAQAMVKALDEETYLATLTPNSGAGAPVSVH